MIIEIKHFVKTGKFGIVEIGMPKQVVVGLLGKPAGLISCSKPNHGIHYSYYEFIFDPSNVLTGIQNDNYNPEFPDNVEFRNEVFEVDPWFLRYDSRPVLREISNLLSDEGISFETVEYLGRKAILVASSGVIIDFDEEPIREDQRALVGIRLWRDD